MIFYQIIPRFVVRHSSNYNGNINATSSVISSLPSVQIGINDFQSPTYYGYFYDASNRLIAADASVMNILESLAQSRNVAGPKSFGDEIYNYDDVGNILQLKRGIINSNSSFSTDVMNYTYLHDKLISAGIRNYGYDANGNMNSDDFRKITIHEYGRANLPFYESKVDGSNITHDINYIYDIKDSRIFKEDMNHSSNVLNLKEYYLNDQFGNTLSIYDYLNNTWKDYAYADNKRIADINNGIPTYYIYDHLGNTRVKYTPIVNCNGTFPDPTIYRIDNVEEYYPYGKVLREYLRNNPEKYLTTQHERDAETGLDYRGARYYDSDIGRFLSIDPLEYKYFNLSGYCYVAGNTLKYIDRSGEQIVLAQPQYRNDLLNRINQLSYNQYKYLNDGSLVIDKERGVNNNGSKYYSEKLDQALVKTDKVIKIFQQQTYIKDGHPIDIDAVQNGGVTINVRDAIPSVYSKNSKPDINGVGNPIIYVSGNSGHLKGNDGFPIKDDPEYVLMHEIVGHAVPQIYGNYYENAIDNENVVRSQLNVPFRAAEENHPALKIQ
jgi:RHS repeat-associated protein